jgi:ATP-dependent Lhr-like helicase
VDFDRIEEMLARCAGRLDHKELEGLSPFAAPLFLEMGRVPIKGAAEERLLAAQTARLMEASGLNKIVIAPVQ